MHKDERDLLDVLKFELEFIEKGGYGRSPREPWRPRLIFEDSPTCMNYDSKENPAPCAECVLMELVPPAMRGEKIPCRHIPFNAAGESLDSLYRYSDDFTTEDAVRDWLRITIAALEARRHTRASVGTYVAGQGTQPRTCEPLFQNLHPKCANPACPAAFHWLAGGRFFRFRPSPDEETLPGEGGAKSAQPEGTKHFWLCERCCHALTLIFDPNHGVIVQPIRQAFPPVEPSRDLPAPKAATR